VNSAAIGAQRHLACDRTGERADVVLHRLFQVEQVLGFVENKRTGLGRRHTTLVAQ
jgi:hypothetical protein